MEGLHRNECLQIGDPQVFHTGPNLLEHNLIVEDEREVALDAGEARQRLISYLAQIVPIEPVKIKFAEKNILPQLS